MMNETALSSLSTMTRERLVAVVGKKGPFSSIAERIVELIDGGMDTGKAAEQAIREQSDRDAEAPLA
ncbi:MAG TPA: hypothetical protein DCX25_01345 [Candidatus Pacebacteria bacterium]|nr:MAG: hypothetical protein UX00_C0010G0054 [Microgenomates group bacterium GW2011_GWB1_45_17]KKU23615.1 MAG: hypothetical protein UX36_C0004G0068 [Microgenomates group bacterium GW2011_GWC1_46_15]KKU24334.1 MAG: hypothetical protein UX35_C0002G0068 [Microgenomates group bacterium GW2011_GWA1_46_15]HAV14951.1 hypothetical protein [Candidatus Paceibacterota bacterium]HCR11298.1 hypothetical protein [Candidatus Paceibacterota bacterium]